MKSDICDERNFQQAVRRALRKMGDELQAQAASRQDRVIGRLKEEIAKLRPRKEELLHGNPRKPE